MEYLFGHTENYDTLRTKSKRRSNLKGYQEVVQTYPDSIVTDNFVIVKKIDSKEDSEGNCYDWYAITRHNHSVDMTPGIQTKLLQIERLSLELTADHEARICEIELGVK